MALICSIPLAVWAACPWHNACARRSYAARTADSNPDRHVPLRPDAVGVHAALAGRHRADDGADLPRLARMAADRARGGGRGRVAAAARAPDAHEGRAPVVGRARLLVLAAGARLIRADHEPRPAAAHVDGAGVLLGSAGRGRRLRAGGAETLSGAATGRRGGAPLSRRAALSDAGRLAAVRVHARRLHD